MNKEKVVSYTIKDVTEPKTGYTVKADCYWLCEDGDPKKALFHNQTAQCNKDKRITDWVYKGAYKSDASLQVIFIPIAYIPPIMY